MKSEVLFADSKNQLALANLSQYASLGQHLCGLSFHGSTELLAHQAGEASSLDQSQGCRVSDSAVADTPGIQGRAWPATEEEALLPLTGGLSHRHSRPGMLAEGQQGTSQPWRYRTAQESPSNHLRAPLCRPSHLNMNLTFGNVMPSMQTAGQKAASWVQRGTYHPTLLWPTSQRPGHETPTAPYCSMLGENTDPTNRASS